MNPVRRHGKFMKNRAEKAGGYVKKKRKIVVGILAALLCMTTGAYGYFSDRLEVKNHITLRTSLLYCTHSAFRHSLCRFRN